ncbi:uncharacterized protein LOC6531177 [Drosophila yakuba]|uniref:Uncharacterized protein n=1 Tax=Drosophila yakuba TaxID=7245 RepID=B4P517_DROYA|nr:uncharacterized protein LOC6531177 [Drosophila yakuba]EDW91718.1 uncharacterized protein Dyak_GE13952 [Drosophila yakuba]
MWSVRRGIASATAEGLRKLSPNLGQYSYPLQSWCHPALHSTNFVKKLEATRNYLRITEEPELPNLVKVYEQLYRGCHKIPVGSTKLRKSALNDPPKKFRQQNDLQKNPGNILNLAFNNLASKSNSTISGSKRPQRHFMNLTDPKISNPQKNFKSKNIREAAGSNIPKIDSPLLKLPQARYVHKILKNSNAKSTTSTAKIKTKTKAKNYSKTSQPRRLSRKKFLKNFNSVDEFLENLRTSKLRNFKYSSPFSTGSLGSRTKNRSQRNTVTNDENDTTTTQDNTKQETDFERSSMTPWDQVFSMSWLPKLERNFLSPGPTDLYDFGPLDIQSYVKDFQSTHSIQPYVKAPSSSAEKPRTKRVRIKEKKLNLQRAPRRQFKKKFCVTGSCKRPNCFAKPYKYHLFRFEICPRKRRTRKKTVSCQTEVNRNRCELCDFSRPKNEPDEPFMIEMKRRQDREQLKKYYLKMAEREIQYSTDTEPKSFAKSRTSCNDNVGKMRHELKKCLVTLNLCGSLVEHWLQLSRCKRRI